jgi:transposase InsO family protein
VYLRAYASVPEARASIGLYIDAFYNARRPHSSLDRRTPDEAYKAVHKHGNIQAAYLSDGFW